MKVGNATSNKGQGPHFFRALRDILPADGLLVSDEERRPYECDGLTGYRELPLAVAMPDQLDQVEEISCRIGFLGLELTKTSPNMCF